jgi:hypothetical protein
MPDKKVDKASDVEFAKAIADAMDTEKHRMAVHMVKANALYAGVKALRHVTKSK